MLEFEPTLLSSDDFRIPDGLDTIDGEFTVSSSVSYFSFMKERALRLDT